MKIKEFIKILIEKFDWTNIKNDSGSWSPGEVQLIIEKEFNKFKQINKIHKN